MSNLGHGGGRTLWLDSTAWIRRGFEGWMRRRDLRSQLPIATCDNACNAESGKILNGCLLGLIRQWSQASTRLLGSPAPAGPQPSRGISFMAPRVRFWFNVFRVHLLLALVIGWPWWGPVVAHKVADFLKENAFNGNGEKIPAAK